MRAYGIMAAMVLAFYVVESRCGPIGGTRLFGVLLLLSAIWSIREPELTLLAYAPEITCMSSRYAHLCHA